MVTHIVHERNNNEVLQDGCPRCEEHASRPLQSLDADHLRELVAELLAVEYGEDDNETYRSKADAMACHRLMPALRFAARYPQLVEQYREKAGW